MNKTANGCDAVARTPWSETVRAYGQQRDPELSEPLACELAEGHPGDHADQLGDMGRGTFQVWVRWGSDQVTYIAAPTCGMKDPTIDPVHQDVCTLYREHPPGHSWEIREMFD
ncbi:hypothetical protein [Streptomyces sp. ITFR-6]|uniref:hypothetical protein n=1 Tax=Streptomyces sp. ITFR-6 TaxID=3075197 RepID=UPI00288A79F3|nr:hypothetical protein [Streptomyces sp. ITFR-6]WNI30185.1 hypothetical protein RLT59_16345 [Streptomyces sp. ITFR-6]